MNTTNPLTKPHYPILDGLRGVAAVTVVAFHTCEAHATDHLTQLINHGYLAVDFFFLLSGFVIGYAYDDRWGKMTISSFFKRRLARLQPMVILGSIIGALCFYFQDSVLWPNIHLVPVWKTALIMLIGCTLIPVTIGMDIRGWEEMHPLDGPGWSLFFEYIVNILYALFIRKLSKTVLAILVALAAFALIQYAVTCPRGDVVGGWTLNAEHMRIGFTRVLYPFFAGLLLFRIARLRSFNNAFFWCSLALVVILAMPRIGGAEHLWLNGIYESLCIIVVFPLIIYAGAGAAVNGKFAAKTCKFLGDISYPLYMVHYPLVYIYTGWVANHKFTLPQSWPYALLTFVGSILLALACLKWYDEPVRRWLKKKME